MCVTTVKVLGLIGMAHCAGESEDGDSQARFEVEAHCGNKMVPAIESNTTTIYRPSINRNCSALRLKENGEWALLLLFNGLLSLGEG